MLIEQSDKGKSLHGIKYYIESSLEYWQHKVLIYIEHHSVCPLVGIGTPPHPFSHKRVCPPPPDQRVGGHTRLRLKGWGSPNSNDWRNA
jgi:hypothetical protein